MNYIVNPETAKKEKSCGIIIFAQDGGNWKVMLIRHKAGSHWAFPKGHVEPGESEYQTAKREVREETDIKVEINTHFRSVVTYASAKNTLKDVVYFVAVIPSIRETHPQASEIQEITWCDISNAIDVVTFPNDKQVLKQAIEYLQNNWVNFNV